MPMIVGVVPHALKRRITVPEPDSKRPRPRADGDTFKRTARGTFAPGTRPGPGRKGGDTAAERAIRKQHEHLSELATELANRASRGNVYDAALLLRVVSIVFHTLGKNSCTRDNFEDVLQRIVASPFVYEPDDPPERQATTPRSADDHTD
ncbi:MAG: hypothetical protein JSS27_15540 [Planctomycetes bacterium]|nr:hypothetical protein [Planctomycetota bacterium]